MKKTINLTKINGCYSKELRENTYTIKMCLNEPSVSLKDMVNVILAIIEPASINAEAKQRFIENLHKCDSKESVDRLCYDAVIHGMYYRPKSKQST